MFSEAQLAKTLFFDIETACGKAKFSDLSEAEQSVWSKRCLYLRERFEDNKDMPDAELYDYKGALHSEFNKIICVSLGRVVNGEIKIISYSGDNEADVLNKTHEAIDKFISMGFTLCGHSIKRFDIPVLAKRTLINGIELPGYLMIHNSKPWELPFLDTADVWSFGAWQEGTASLESIAVSLGIPTPKDDISGKDVNETYYRGKGLDTIVKYCEKDVIATTKVLYRISNKLNLINE